MDFLGYAGRRLPLAAEGLELCRAFPVPVRFEKGRTLFVPGAIHDRVLFLGRGVARSYSLDTQGEDYTAFLHFNEPGSEVKNLFLVDYASFLSQTPSHLIFEAISELTAQSLSYRQVQQLYEASPRWERFGRLMAEQVYCALHERVFSLQTESASQRYQKLLKEAPHWIGKVPDYHLASYLGIKPQSLSRIRRQLKTD